MLPNPGLGFSMANGPVKMYAGSVNTIKDAVLTILHEYGHHSAEVIGARVRNIYQTPSAERYADRYARRVSNEINR